MPALGEPDNLTQGIQLARGELVKPLYDDDVLEANAIERLVSALTITSDARLATGLRCVIDASGRRMSSTVTEAPLGHNSRRFHGTSIIQQMLASGTNLLGEPTCMLFRREDALAIDERNVMSLSGRLCSGFGDVCLAFHLLSEGDLAYVAEPLARIRSHIGQTQQKSDARESAIVSMLHLRKEGLRRGFKVPKSSIIVNKILIKFKSIYPFVRAKRAIQRSVNRLSFRVWR
jgi:hypothetical protein